MTKAQHLQSLFAAGYQRQTATHKTSYQSLIPFLHVPLRERLVLLCLLEGATMPEIKAVLPYAKETDVRLTSRRMGNALKRLDEAFADPWIWIHPGPVPAADDPTADVSDPEAPFLVTDRLIPTDTDKQLRQIFYSCIPIMLFGEGVPAALNALDLRARGILYLLVVDELTWQEIEAFLSCSEWSIRRAIKDAENALGGL